MKKHLSNIVIGVSVAAAVLFAVLMVVIRFFSLQEPFIYDEVYSWVTANPAIPLSTVWHDILLKDVNLPLFNLVLRAWAYVVPFTIGWLRVLPLIFSIAVIGVAWVLAPHRWSKLEKFSFCCLLAASCGLVSYSDVVRSYSMGVFFTVIFDLLALRILDAFIGKERIPLSWWIGFYSAGLVASYTHFFACGIFFITCLFLFIYACIYKRARCLVFWTTALAFVLWIPWLYNTYSSLNHFSDGWWYETNKILSSWEIIQYCLGTSEMAGGLLLLLVIGLISILLNEKGKRKEYTDVWLPLFQIVTLILVLLALSARYNLFMNRYFLMTLPGFFILIVALWKHLCGRWIGIVLLLPLFLYANTLHFFHYGLPRTEDPSGLMQSFEYARNALHVQKVLVLMDPITYPGVSRWPIMHYYVPKEYPLETIELTKENASLMKSPDNIPLIVPLCSFYRVIMASVEYQFDLPNDVVAFKQTCIL